MIIWRWPTPLAARSALQARQRGEGVHAEECGSESKETTRA
jgi:hypothetical protein